MKCEFRLGKLLFVLQDLSKPIAVADAASAEAAAAADAKKLVPVLVHFLP